MIGCSVKYKKVIVNHIVLLIIFHGRGFHTLVSLLIILGWQGVARKAHEVAYRLDPVNNSRW